MADDKNYPNWFLWLYENFLFVLMAGALVGALLLGGIYMLESRLSDIEGRLSAAPPRSYVPPDLAEFDAGGTKLSDLTMRRTVYVPVYSHIYYQGGAAYSLESTLSIRNVDVNEPLYIESVEYYDTDGTLAKTQVDEPIKLKPLQTIEFLIERKDSTGGSGANFLVRWGATSDVDQPLIESVMVGTAGTQGISFARTGIEVSAGESTEP